MVKSDMPKPLETENIRRILIRSTNWVGDAVMTTPAVQAVRENFPDAEITILAKPWVTPVFWNNPHINRIETYDAKGLHRGWTGKLRLAGGLRRQHFDLAVLFQNAFEAALLAFLAGIPRRLGYDTDGRRCLLTHPVKTDPGLKRIHEVHYYLSILDRVGLEQTESPSTLFLTASEREQARSTFAEFGLGGEGPMVGICPGATYGSAKRWFPERYGALGDRIFERYGAEIVIFGGPGEESVGQKVCEAMRARCINLCARTTLRQAMAAIEQCDLFVTNDSGLMHVAAALEVPVIAIFGSTNPVTTGPRSANSQIVRVAASCSPCLKTECPEDHRCMRAVSVDRVYEAAEKVLDK